jgi:signal peptidase I
MPNGARNRIYRYERSDRDIERYKLFHGLDVGKTDYRYKDMKAIKVPENHYFLLGDYRSNSIDSRNIGAIPREQIFGKVIEIKQKKK